METLSRVLGILAAIVHVSAYITYNVYARKKWNEPNPATWFVSFVAAGANALTFSVFSSWALAVQSWAGALSSLTTFILMLFVYKIRWPSKRERAIIGVSLIGIVFWLVFKQAEWGNLLVVGVLCFAASPTLGGVIKNPKNEMSLPWWLWTCAFTITLVNAFVAATTIFSFVLPVFGVLVHAAVAIFSSKRRKARFLDRPLPAG
jgi:hypothetical protein